MDDYLVIAGGVPLGFDDPEKAKKEARIQQTYVWKWNADKKRWAIFEDFRRG